MSSEKLFAGKPVVFGGLTNENELTKLCPDEFKENNPWSSYASKLFFEGGHLANWQWKSSEDTVRQHQIGCLIGLLGTFGIKHEDKESVAGWMLSEMPTEVPDS